MAGKMQKTLEKLRTITPYQPTDDPSRFPRPPTQKIVNRVLGKPMRSDPIIGPKKQVVSTPSDFAALYALQGSLREFPLEIDLEEERRAALDRENEQ
jgi:hypothetical protein